MVVEPAVNCHLMFGVTAVVVVNDAVNAVPAGVTVIACAALTPHTEHAARATSMSPRLRLIPIRSKSLLRGWADCQVKSLAKESLSLPREILLST
jgi:hypothetical protein